MFKPLVTTPADGARQFVKQGENGLIFPIGDAAALASCVQTLAADKILAKRLVDNGYATYQRLFSRDVVVQNLRDIYASVRSNGHTAPGS